jgi:pyruvate kinase
MIRSLFDAGVDMFRLNFSHGTHGDHKKRFEAIRDVERDVGRPIGIMMDLQGPKLRIGTFSDGPVELRSGDKFCLDLEATPGDRTRVPLPHPEIFAALVPGTDLLLDDGKVRLEVLECGPHYAETRVKIGGRLSERKGVNVPGVILHCRRSPKRTVAISSSGLNRGPTGSRFVCAKSGRYHWGTGPDWFARLDHGEAGEACGHRQSRCDRSTS